MGACFSCGLEIVVTGRVGRGDACPKCAASLHCCRNCQFYDPSSYNECREPAAERVVDKENANFCEEFVWTEQRRTVEDKGAEAKRRLAELFRKKS